MNNFILKGDICYSKNISELHTINNGFVICLNGKSKGVFKKIPEEFKNLPIVDYSNYLIIPGLCDLHTHAPQYPFTGLGMDSELLEWLNTRTFPEEIKYSNIEYAEKSYQHFTQDLLKSATTRACIFATVHKHSTQLLMKKLEKTGLHCYVGLVNMDINAPDTLCDSSTESLINLLENHTFKNVLPILTPRFIPSCSNKLLKRLAIIRDKYNLPIQSHLSENTSEWELVKLQCPNSLFYGDAYNQYRLFGKSENKYFRTVMAHCIHSCDDEINLMKENKVFMAHCPSSNINLASGIAPVRKMLENNVKIGLGTDIAAGNSLSVLRAVTDCIQVSKLYFSLIDKSKKPLTFAESFFLATKGGGEFFGNVGSFENNFEFDAIVIDDSKINSYYNLSISERLERFSYISGNNFEVKSKYVNGEKLF